MKVRHAMLFLLCVMYFIAYIDRVNISTAALMIRTELGLTPTEVGLVFSSFAYPYAGMQIFGGWLADRFGPRRVLAALSLIWSSATVMTGVSTGLTALVACRVLVGAGEGGAFPTATRAFTFWLPARERGFAQGITHSFARLGGAITPPIVLVIVARSGWRASFIVLGVASVAWTVAWVAFFRDTPEEHDWVSDAELAEIHAGAGSMRPSHGPTPWRQIVSRMWLVTLVDFCYGWSLWVFLTWLPSYLRDARGFTLDRLALMTMLPLLGGVVGDTLGGVLSDAIFRRTGNLTLARRSLLVVGLTGALVFMVPAIVVENALAAVWLLGAAFFFLELTNAVLWTLPLDIAGPYAGTAGGMMNTGFAVAGMISPVVFGVLIERTRHYELPLSMSAALLLLGAICSLAIDPTRTVVLAPVDSRVPA